MQLQFAVISISVLRFEGHSASWNDSDLKVQGPSHQIYITPDRSNTTTPVFRRNTGGYRSCILIELRRLQLVSCRQLCLHSRRESNDSIPATPLTTSGDVILREQHPSLSSLQSCRYPQLVLINIKDY